MFGVVVAAVPYKIAEFVVIIISVVAVLFSRQQVLLLCCIIIIYIVVAATVTELCGIDLMLRFDQLSYGIRRCNKINKQIKEEEEGTLD